MMNNVAFTVALLVCSSLYSNYYVSASLEVSKESKYYNRIDDHLSKKVANVEDVEANYQELKRWYEGKHSIFNSGSTLWPVAAQVLNMKKASEDCRRFYVLDNNDKGLCNSIRIKEDNYPLRPLDRLVQHFFTKYATKCGIETVNLEWKPLANFGWRRKAFKKLNQLVRSSLTPGDTLAKVRDLLVKLERAQPDGALTDVARSVVDLESVLGENKCTYKAYEMIMAIEVGVKDFGGEPGQAEELKYLVMDMIRSQRGLCQDIWLKMYRAKMRELDEKSLRSLAIMISEFFFFHYSKVRSEYVEGIEHSKYPQINPDLRTPEAIELVKRVGEASKGSSINYKLSLVHPQNMTYSEGLPLDLRKFIPESHPDHTKFVEANYDQLEALVPALFNEYIIEPCEKYLSAINEILVPSMHFYGGSIVADVPLDQVEERLGYSLGQALLDMCDSAIYFKGKEGDKKDLDILVGLMNKFRKD